MNAPIQCAGRGLIVMFLAGLLTGCISPKAYLDPQYRHATYASIESRAESVAILVDLTFQTNGKDKPAVATQVRPQVSKILRASHVVSDHAALANAPRLRLVINNIADLGDARAKGFATGLTFGGAGSAVVDYYEMTAEFTSATGSSGKKTYKHAIHTTIGAHAAPPGLEAVAPETAFEHALEDMLLNLLQDLQKEKLL